MPRRAAIVTLSHADVEAMLNLPPETHIKSIHYNWRTEQMELVIQAPFLPEVPDTCEPPIVQRELRVEVCDLANIHYTLLFPERKDVDA